MALPIEGQCANCQTSTMMYCSRCKLIDPDGHLVSATYYCSASCQKTNLGDHKSNCLAPLQLFRGGMLLQEAFSAFREVAFDLKISKVEVIDGKLHFHEGRYNEEILCRFPDELVSDPKDKQTLLMHNTCCDPFAHMLHLITRSLKGILNEHQPAMEGTVKMPHRLTQVVHHHLDGTLEEAPQHHVFLKLSLPHEDHYVVDITRPQFRQDQVVFPLNVYEETFRPNKASYEKLGSVATNIDYAYAKNPHILHAHRYVAEAFITGMHEWEKKAAKSIAKMLRSKDTVFIADKRAFLDAVKSRMGSSLDLYKSPKYSSMEGEIENGIKKDGDKPGGHERGETKTTSTKKPRVEQSGLEIIDPKDFDRMVATGNMHQSTADTLREFEANGGTVRTYL